MEFELLPALIAGFVGTVAMTLGITMGKSMGMTTMDIALISGGMMSGDERKARRGGLFVHLIVMGTLVFGTIYAFLFQALDSASWVTGLIVGVVHGVVVGIMGMNYGKGTPLGLLMGHAVYGVVVALIYSALV